MKHLSLISPEYLTEKLSLFLASRGLLDQVSKSMLFVSKTARVTLENVNKLNMYGAKNLDMMFCPCFTPKNVFTT